MKLLKFPLLLLSMAWMLSSCVTTRTELNERKNPKTEDTPAETTVQNDPTETPAGNQYSLEELRAELAKLNGKIEEMEQDKKTQLASQEEEQKKLVEKIESLEKQLKEKEEEANKPALPKGKTGFQAGKEAYQSSRFNDAISFLDDYLSENEAGKEVEEATFLRGDSYFKLKDFKKAIVDFSKFPEKFQKSNFHRKALLKIAESFEALEMKEDAKAFYQDLFDQFPKTVEGKLARKKLNGKTIQK